jgi:hypothetical protein
VGPIEQGREKMPNREFTPSTGNVFAYWNLPHADDLLAQTEFAAFRTQAGQAPGLLDRTVDATPVADWRDVEIIVKGRSRSGSAAKLRVT